MAPTPGLSQSARGAPLALGIDSDKNLTYVVKFYPVRVNLKTLVQWLREEISSLFAGYEQGSTYPCCMATTL